MANSNFVVETNGIYMFRLVYDENEGSSTAIGIGQPKHGSQGADRPLNYYHRPPLMDRSRTTVLL